MKIQDVFGNSVSRGVDGFNWRELSKLRVSFYSRLKTAQNDILGRAGEGNVVYARIQRWMFLLRCLKIIHLALTGGRNCLGNSKWSDREDEESPCNDRLWLWVGAVSESCRDFYFLSRSISPLVIKKKLFCRKAGKRVLTYKNIERKWNGDRWMCKIWRIAAIFCDRRFLTKTLDPVLLDVCNTISIWYL